MRSPVLLRRLASRDPARPDAIEASREAMAGSSRRWDLGPAEALAARYVRDRVLPCIVFGVADRAGLQGVFAISGRRTRASTDAIFFLASVTKAIVATAVMQHVDEGRLDLHAPLGTYLPGFAGGGRERITAWHVLTHTSGLPDVPLEELRRRRPSYTRALASVLQDVPAWPPGSRYAYNSSAWLLLSETIARLSGMPFPLALRTRLTGPLGMTDTTFDPRYARRRIVPMNGFDRRNRLVEEVLLRFLVRATLPGGGMFGTLPDLLRLGQALLPGTDGQGGASAARILSARSITEMSRPQTEGIPRIGPDGSLSYVSQALGWRKPERGWPDRAAAITHGGISGSRLWVDPEQGLAFAFLSNLWHAPDEAASTILEEVYRAAPSGAPAGQEIGGGDGQR